ncbi:hypothetical protein KAR91_17515 [Candidatus Pacearchaeota archaeon]|nr:hypothetical protein [Candidatus Pacearchaeota archaeon]
MNEALEGSIKKWEDILAGKIKDTGPGNCPLCQEHFVNDCEGCVVKETSGYGCKGLPYEAWCDHNVEAHGVRSHGDYYVHDGCATCKELAQAMIDSLKSLR